MYYSCYLKTLVDNSEYEDIRVINVLPKHSIEKNVNIIFGGEINDSDIKVFSDIFTKEYETNDVYTISITNGIIGPRPRGIPRYWPILFRNGYLRDFINPLALQRLQEQGILKVSNDYSAIDIDRKNIKFQCIRGQSIWVHIFGNIDHFYRESLPAIHVLKKTQNSIRPYNIVISSSCSDARLNEFIEIIKLYGITSEQIILLKDQWLHFDSLLLMNFSSLGHLHTPSEYYLETSEYVRDVINSDINEYPDKIFVSRKRAHQRLIDNEDDLCEFFHSKGYFICDPGEYSVAEQINLFSRAEIIAGAHGMGMANSIFSRNLTLIIEIMSTKWNRVSYFRTAQLKDADYSCYWLQPAPNGILKIDMKKFEIFYAKTKNATEK